MEIHNSNHVPAAGKTKPKLNRRTGLSVRVFARVRGRPSGAIFPNTQPPFSTVPPVLDSAGAPHRLPLVGKNEDWQNGQAHGVLV